MNGFEIGGLSLVALGLLFFFGTVLGVHRFPDFYTRMHGAAKGDTLSSLLMILGILLISIKHFDVVTSVRAAKLFFIILFLFIASPAAAHALISAGYRKGVQPWQQRAADSKLSASASREEEA